MIPFTLYGQIPSGKNAVIVTRTGHRFPAKRFKEWLSGAMLDILQQKFYLQSRGQQFPLERPVKLIVNYTPGDLRTRDVSGMADALLHLLEKAGIVKNDGQVHELAWIRLRLNREKPGVLLGIAPYKEQS